MVNWTKVVYIVHVLLHAVQGRSKGGGGGGGGGGAWGGLSPPKILVQHIIYNSIHVDVIVRAVPQIEHIPLLQAAHKFRTRKCGQPSTIRDASF